MWMLTGYIWRCSSHRRALNATAWPRIAWHWMTRIYSGFISLFMYFTNICGHPTARSFDTSGIQPGLCDTDTADADNASHLI